MSPAERQAPPAGEEIHLPGPTIKPLLLSVAITLALVGLTFHKAVLVIGVVLTVVVIVAWIADTRRDIAELPLEHSPH